jgi:pyruvate,orthophosphate dikinase
VVAGGARTEPIEALGERLPDVAAELRQYADRLERHYADMCDIEFTVESGRLWLLQVRSGKRSPRAALRLAVEMADDEAFPLSREDAVRRVANLLADPPREFVISGARPMPLAVGLPASPGVASGAIATSSEEAEAVAGSGTPVILVRATTSPADVRGMAVAAGILTARGGFASHAAVVARGWGIPAVVGAAQVEPGDGAVAIGSRRFPAGAEITIDGTSGEIFEGVVVGVERPLAEVETLRGWAADLGIVLEAPTPAPVESDTASGTGDLDPPTEADVLRALLVRGQCEEAALATALVAVPETLDPILARLASSGSIERTPAGIRLTPDGRLTAQSGFAAERDRIGEDQCAAALETFHELDARMKAVVTAWQIRDDGGDQRLNDHADADYDAGVLARLDELQVDVGSWLASWGSASRPMRAYGSRLATAAELARNGDHRFLASPRVDSYHSAWFELHEDLIRLAGRTRDDVPDA